MPIEVVNPFTNQKIKEFEEFSESSIQSIITKGDEAFKKWSRTTFEDRSKLLKRAAQLLRERIEEYAKIMTEEMGKPIRESKKEIEKCAMACDHYADHASEYLADERLEVKEGEGFISYEPLGVILAIMPWNFPFWQVFRFAAPTLMAGNVGLLKHASNVPQCALAIEQIFKDAGFPDGVFSSLLIGNEKVETVIKDDRVKAVTLTGSDLAGSKVAELAGKYIKKTVLELGGSDPFIVLDDADLEQAATIALKSRMVNCGQSCIAAKRFIIHEAVVEDFITLFKNKMSQLTLGDPTDDDIDYGPLAREDLAEKIMEQVKKSVALGAKVILGGNRPDRAGAFFNPTILSNVKPGMPAFDEELFGPVAAIIVVKNDDGAVEVANNSQYGLGGSVWTKNMERGKAVARKVASGSVYINTMMASDIKAPFGGIKNSGYGRELSYLGIREFVNIKTIKIL